MKYSNFDEEMTSYHHKTKMTEKRLMLHIKWVIGKSNKDKIKMKKRFNAKQDVSFALFPSCIFFVIFVVLVVPAMGIYCFKGTSLTPSKNDVVDCSRVGLQREELYCRNVSEFLLENGHRKLIKVNRTCVASTWYATGFGLEFKCEDPYKKNDVFGHELSHREEQQCTCKENFCNSPPGFDVDSVFDVNSSSSIIEFLKLNFNNLAMLSIFGILLTSYVIRL